MRILSLGEMMVEFSGDGSGHYRQSFAGDSFNTAWYLAALRPQWKVSYGTKLGADDISRQALSAIRSAGIGSDWVTFDNARSIGLYVIALRNGERSFSYWRTHSAARLLANDPDWLEAALSAHDIIYLSGITLAVLEDQGRDNLLDALRGRRVVFDPNIRPALWESAAIMRETLTRAAALCEICLPSFEDEAAAFGDVTPEATAKRYASAGAREVVVKNGAGPLSLSIDGKMSHACPRQPILPTDTTGAGDSFNAAFLAARLSGSSPQNAVVAGQTLAAVVVQHPGALAPREIVKQMRVTLDL